MGRIADYYVSDVSKKKDSLYRLQTFYNYFRAIDEALSAGGLRGHQMIVKEMKAINGSPTRSNALSDKDKDHISA